MKGEEPPPGSRRENDIPRRRFATPGININDNSNDDAHYTNSDNIVVRIDNNTTNSHNNGNNINKHNNTTKHPRRLRVTWQCVAII